MPKAANLIVFLSDNHNRQFLGAAGHPFVKTPAIDSIANRGVRFNNAWCVSPLCCPSRAAIATGRYPHQTGFWDNALAYDGSVPTWHHRVRDNGNNATVVGKLHYRSGSNNNDQSSGQDNGFTEEIDTMHIVDGKGALASLLRATDEGVPKRRAHKAIYEDSVPGDAEYQVYDRRVTKQAIKWLQANASQSKPWVLLVSYVSPHPPFKVPQRYWDMYPPQDMSLPVQWRRDERPVHPADQYRASINYLEDEFSEDFVRRVVAGYCGLITHTDEQIGEVLAAAESLGLTESSRIMYTSDHGEAACQHGILGKANHYEHALGVPLVIAGPDIEAGQVVEQSVSHVDLFPTILESVGISLTSEDADLPGRSLWQVLQGSAAAKPVLAEFHAYGSRNSGFAIRDGDFKLIYHVDMPNQLFDLVTDPDEENDLLANGGTHPKAEPLERILRQQLDPEEINDRCKADQARHMELFGGAEAVRKTGMFSRSPIPGSTVEIEKV